MKVPHLQNRVVALRADNGKELWRYDAPSWDHFGAAGDEEGFVERSKAFRSGENLPVCLPDLQGIPVINSYEGRVYMSSSHDGNLTVLEDVNKDGVVQQNETVSFAPGVAFLNSPSMAPGLLVAAPCWGPTYVWTA